jgi:hypothetical protein
MVLYKPWFQEVLGRGSAVYSLLIVAWPFASDAHHGAIYALWLAPRGCLIKIWHLRGVWHPFPRASVSLNRRLGGESNREIVSCRAGRAYVRARGVGSSEISAKSWVAPFPFSLLAAPAFPFSLTRPYVPFSLANNISYDFHDS